MLLTIKRSAIEFCLQQLQQVYKSKQKKCLNKQFISSIDIQAFDTKHTIYIGINQELLQDIHYLFFENDEHVSHEDLINMSLETINMIVGHAKTLTQEIQEIKNFTIGTPKFINYTMFNYSYKQQACLGNKNKYLTIAIKDQ